MGTDIESIQQTVNPTHVGMDRLSQVALTEIVA